MAHLRTPGLLAALFLALLVLTPAPARAENEAAASTTSTAPAEPAAKLAPLLVRLRPNITVDGKTVTLGDLFQGASPAAAARPFAAAPAPGQQASFGIDQVVAAARAAGLDWEPDPNLGAVTISRTARFVPLETVLAQLTQALATATGQTGDMIQIAGRSPQLAIAISDQASVRVENLQYDPTSHQFSAMLLAPADDPDAPRVPVQGRVVQATEVPVPAGRIGPGQIIHKSDLRWLNIPVERIDRNAVTDEAELIGKAARHALREGWPIRADDIERPVLVTKGAMVTVSLDAPNLSLSTVGQAQQAGGQGDLIAVLNVQSHKTIIGIIVGPNRVAIENGRVAFAAAN